MPCRLLDARGIEAVSAGEAPRAAGDDAHPEPLVFTELDAGNLPVFDHEVLHSAVDDAAVGVVGSGGHGRVECALSQVPHGRRVYGPPLGIPVSCDLSSSGARLYSVGAFEQTVVTE